MPTLNLATYGIKAKIELTGVVQESPARDADVLAAPIIILVDEDHNTQLAIDENAQNVSRLLQAVPRTVVVLEHFPAGEKVVQNSPRTHGGSNFHVLLHQLVGNATTLGGDAIDILPALCKIEDEYQRRINDIVADIRNPPPRDVIEAEKARLKEEGLIKVREYPGQLVRSRRLIDTVLEQVNATNRVGIINAGSNHNTHIWDNDPAICDVRSRVTLIRLRPQNHPTPLVIQ